MAERSYTVNELNQLRAVVENKCLWGRYTRATTGWSRQFAHGELSRMVEQMVQTHMLAGHTAEDLLASEPPATS